MTRTARNSGLSLKRSMARKSGSLRATRYCLIPWASLPAAVYGRKKLTIRLWMLSIFPSWCFLLDHQTAWALGKVGVNMTAVVDETGLFIDVTLRDTWLDDYVYDRVEAGILDGMSFWFDSRSIVATDWASKTDVILKINEVYEVSIVAFPAYEETVIITDEPDGEEPEEPEEPGNEDPIKQALVNLIEAY